MKLISFDIQSDFGFFRKPETNNTLNLSFNMIHKPAVLGILGAIIGLEGYKKKGELPEYYKKLKDIKIGIAPLNHDNGNYAKTPIKYSNTVGYANKGTNFLTEELTLVNPKYCIYLLLDETNAEQNQLINNIKNIQSEFVPYFGKNEFSAWWDNVQEYDFQEAEIAENESIQIGSLFLKNQILKDNTEAVMTEVDLFNFDLNNLDNESLFIYFERLPIDFNLDLMQYQLAEMVFTNYSIKNVGKMNHIYHLNNEKYIQFI